MIFTPYFNQPNCCKLSNGEVDAIITTDIGPRIIRYAFPDAENILAEIPEGGETTEYGEWHSYGGHRLWHAPEAMPRSYEPDNSPVPYEILNDLSIRLTPAAEPHTGIQKEMTVYLASTGTELTIDMKLINRGPWPITAAPWGLTIMNGGGVSIFPQEPYRSHSEYLLPARPFVLWHYTDLSDPRWRIGKKYICLSTDEARTNPQKVGFMNKQGWAGYCRKNTLFIKQFPFVEGAEYCDYGCNNESYTVKSFMEIETLAPLSLINPGESTSYSEKWNLFSDFKMGSSDDELDAALQGVLGSIR